MAVPSVQGFAKWNLERCPEVLEAASLGKRCLRVGRSKVKHLMPNMFTPFFSVFLCLENITILVLMIYRY